MSFSDYHSECHTIASVWRHQRQTRDDESQTHPIEYKEVGVEPIHYDSVECQTLDLIDSRKARPLKTYDSPELAKFVSKASKVTIDILTKIKDNDIFDRIDRFQNQNKANVWMTNKFEPTLHELSSEQTDVRFMVSSVCWNSNASVLAVGLKASAHTDWCTHSSFVLFWNLYKTSKHSEPSSVLDIDNCVSLLVSHPSQPSLYCTGAVNGKISVWNMKNSESDALIGSVMAHNSAVTGLLWTQMMGQSSDVTRIISCGMDGRVLVWKVMLKSIELEQAFAVLAQDMPKTMQIKGDKSETEVGIVSMSFNCDDPNIFVIGCVGGALFQCSLLSDKPIYSKTLPLIANTRTALKSPIVMSYVGHRSHISAVQFSPVERNTFFSCSSDSELRINSILQTLPLMVIHTDVPLVSAQWSPSRPTIASVGVDGRVYVYCITDSNVSKASISFPIGEHIGAKSLAYNQIDINNEEIAVITDNNQIQVWNLSMASESTDKRQVIEILQKISLQLQN